MTASDLDAIDPAVSGSDVSPSSTGSGASALLIVVLCVALAVIVAAAVSVFIVTGNAWFGAALSRLFVAFLFGAPAA